MNLKKVYRLYCEEGLAVRRRRGRKRAGFEACGNDKRGVHRSPPGRAPFDMG